MVYNSLCYNTTQCLGHGEKSNLLSGGGKTNVLTSQTLLQTHCDLKLTTTSMIGPPDPPYFFPHSRFKNLQLSKNQGTIPQSWIRRPHLHLRTAHLILECPFARLLGIRTVLPRLSLFSGVASRLHHLTGPRMAT